MNTLIEMTRLSMGRPGGHATDEIVAAWYVAKGRLLRQLAAECQPGAARAAEQAAVAFAHARRLQRSEH
ncbi:MAG TPA: hypothetical protein VK735_12235 [Pseudonocardia sp.]|jgi:hypothetical protein|uniref:hypothetical protein n=1 Tax=Pseudonocardia sp. TaxID=60912 RepID=UPI002BD1B318|nr:hypothetical protein [Pseudonocardia sp.]HTF48209.1 hypothetical protein [Pseudonocardia sp.]